MTSFTWPLPADLTAASHARRLVAQALGDVACLDDALLVASELVTNAVTHGRPPVTLHLQLDDDYVRITVADHGTGFPSDPGTDEPLAPSGRGLGIVASLASSCGGYQTDQGWASWAVIGSSSTG